MGLWRTVQKHKKQADARVAFSMLAQPERPDVTGPGATFFAYGLALAASFPLAVARRSASPLPTVPADLIAEDELLEAWSGTDRAPVLATRMSDGLALSVLQGTEGDHLVRYGDRGLFLISADADHLRCSRATAPDDPGWHRVLLDWVMYVIASLRGGQALHAGAAIVEDRAIAFCALSGGGKTSATLELVARGAELMCDDVLCLSRLGDTVTGQPGVPFVNVVGSDRDAALPGALLGVIGDERWVQVPRAAATPAPIGGVFLVERAEHYDVLRAVDCSLFALREHAVGLSHLVGAELQRFTLLADLMTQATVRRIEAPIRASAAEIAELATDLSRDPLVSAGAA